MSRQARCRDITGTGVYMPGGGAAKGAVLIVDDDATVLDVVSTFLMAAGYATQTAPDGEQAVRMATEQRPDLAVLDLMLPKLSGFDVMQQLRERGPLPVILLTARGQERDLIVGLQLGADDYIPKPFSPAVLVARVDAVLRRNRWSDSAIREPICFADLTIDEAARRVTAHGRDVSLTSREYELLLFLAQHPGVVFSRSDLMDAVWRVGFYSDTRTVPVHIRRLRQKIEDDPARPRLVQTVWGAGYRFQP